MRRPKTTTLVSPNMNFLAFFLPGMAINMLVQKLCREEKVGFMDSWGSFVGRADMYMRGFHLNGKAQ